MNNARRKDLSIAHRLLEIAREIVEDAKNEEEEAHDNLPEAMQFNSERSDDMQDAMNMMDTAIGEIESAEQSLVDYAVIDISTNDLRNAVVR